MTTSAALPTVRFDGISKRFPGVQALTDVTFDIAAGACHALCGENGAGKSTLGKVLAGIHEPDAGRVFVSGRESRFASPRDALAAGIGMVHQELALCPNLSVAENLTLGSVPRRAGFVDRAAMRRRAREMLAQIGAALDVSPPVGTLSIAQQQLVQIAAAVGGGARIIVFDEPTSSLSQREAQRLYELIAQLRATGVTCLYVSHRLPEVFALCDTITVLRDGRHIATRATSDLTQDELVRLMIGRPIRQYFPGTDARAGAEVLAVERLSSPGRFADVSFTLREGEILGLAGLVGAGRSEIATALFGADPAASGSVTLDGHLVRLTSTSAAIAHGIGLVPEDRKRQGLVGSASGLHNASLAILDRVSRARFVRRREERAVVGAQFERLRLPAFAMDTTVARLSGGTQQKVVLSRWLAAGVRVLILDEPTRGVDVGAKAEIHALIGELAARGSAVLLISSELPELLGLAHRILVLRQGRVAGEVAAAGATEDGVLRLMAGL